MRNGMGTTAVMKQLNARFITFLEPERQSMVAFLMPIEDVFSIQGRGTVVTGRS